MVEKITPEQMSSCYELVKEGILEGNRQQESVVKELMDAHGMSGGSASDHVSYLVNVMEGNKIRMSGPSEANIRIVFDKIFENYKNNPERIKKSLNGFSLNIEYHEEDGNLAPLKRKLHNEFRKKIGCSPVFESHPPHDWRTKDPSDMEFSWTTSYEELSSKLLNYQSRQDELYNFLIKIGVSIRDNVVPFNAMCPFTFISLLTSKLSQGFTIPLTEIIIEEFQLQSYFFTGAPMRPSLRTCFMETLFFQNERPRQFERLWILFCAAIEFTENKNSRDDFIKAYDDTPRVYQVGGNTGTNLPDAEKRNEITMGLHWIRPWDYPNLDLSEQYYIENALGIEIRREGVGQGESKACTAENYLEVRDKLLERFKDPKCPIRSFPELSLAAAENELEPRKDTEMTDIKKTNIEDSQYNEDRKMIEEFCKNSFIDNDELVDILQRLRDKKNLILQGPPGTGKTWLAKKLACALMREEEAKVKIEGRLISVQFHPNMSYEDFVRGYRPSGDDDAGGSNLKLANGHFLKMVERAENAIKSVKQGEEIKKYVIVIEEINRGNPAQIFGELLTLLESTKRTDSEAVYLSHQEIPLDAMALKDNNSFQIPVYIPENLYIIGTMNLADRSLASLDLALRRRFAFANLEPFFDDKWIDFSISKSKINKDFWEKIKDKMNRLNGIIAGESTLGKHFCIGHSFFTPEAEILNPDKWFKDIVKMEIIPLLEEYYFDNADKLDEAKAILL